MDSDVAYQARLMAEAAAEALAADSAGMRTWLGSGRRFVADAQNWLDNRPKRLNAKLVDLADGTRGVKYTDPSGDGPGGIVDGNNGLVSFRYGND